MSNDVAEAAGLHHPGLTSVRAALCKTDASLLYRLGQQLLLTATSPHSIASCCTLRSANSVCIAAPYNSTAFHHVAHYCLPMQFALLRFTADAAVAHCVQGSQNLISKHLHGDVLVVFNTKINTLAFL